MRRADGVCYDSAGTGWMDGDGSLDLYEEGKDIYTGSELMS